VVNLNAWRVYSDGTLVVEADAIDRSKPGPTQRVLHKEETHLKPDELAEFVRLTEKPDFLNASTEYVIKRVIDGGSWVTIVYRKGKLEKQVRVYNYFVANQSESETPAFRGENT